MIPRIKTPVVLRDLFGDRTGTLTNWTDTTPSNGFTSPRTGLVRVLEAGELVYSGTPLYTLGGFAPADNADWAIRIIFRGTEDLQFMIRGRRKDSANYIGFSVDFTQDLVRIVESVAGTETTLAQTNHNLRFAGVERYVMGLWMQGNNLHGFLNEFNLLTTTSSNFVTEHGFSLFVPTVDLAAPPKLYSAIVQIVEKQNIPNIVSPSNLLVQHRVLLTEEINNPEGRTWKTFKKAHKLFELYKDEGYTNEQWEEFGYPLSRPSSEEWFGNA